MLTARNAAVLRRNVSASWILWFFGPPAVNLIVTDGCYSSVPVALLAAASHKAAANSKENKGQENGSHHCTDDSDDQGSVAGCMVRCSSSGGR